MFGRKFIGLEISHQGLRAVALKRKGQRRILCGGQLLEFGAELTLPTSLASKQSDPQSLVDAIKEVLLPIAGREERVALCLPDATGHIFLLDIETPFKNRQQGTDIIRWQLKELLPDSYRNVALDYQLLGSSDTGGYRVLVSVLDLTIRQEYEDIVSSAGFSTTLIDFQSLQTYNCYRSKLDFGPDFIFVALNQQQFSMLRVQNGLLDFHRTKAGLDSAEMVFREINRSLVSYRSRPSPFARSSLYLLSDWAEQRDLNAALESAFEAKVQNLPSPLATLSGQENLRLSTTELAGMAAAIGAAESLMWDKG